MKRIVIVVGTIICLNLFGFDPDEKKYPDVLVYNVLRVYDGDTITADISGYPNIIGKKIGIRINGIDTPEIKDKNPIIKKFAKEVRDYLYEKIIKAKRIELKNIDRGKYFRIVADVYIDGVSVKEDLIKKGYAKPYDGGTKNIWTVDDVLKAKRKTTTEIK
jgi:endonuclease YncB( thermonuclease family)